MKKHSTIIKFGGTSMQTPESLNKILNIIITNKNISIIVVSAIKTVTDFLIDLCTENKTIKQKITLIEKIKNIHLVLSNNLNLKIDKKILFILNKLNCLLKIKIINKKLIDSILSIGEYLSSLILYEFLIFKKIKITLINANKYIITNNNFGLADPNIEIIKSRIKNIPNKICIIQGFIGNTINNEITTLGRGGSDYSAALIAEAINAKKLLIYTDVSGVYTADPNIIKDAKLINKINFHEMSEMANFGAKILHPATLEPCLRAKIPIQILSTFKENCIGTNITTSKTIQNQTTQIKAITIRKKQTLVTIKSFKMLNTYGFIANIFNILAKHKISIDIITTSEISVALTIDETRLGSHKINPFIKNKKMISTLKQFANIYIENNLTLLAIIGIQLTNPGTIQKILNLIKKYEIRLVCYGASNSSIGILVQTNKAIQIYKVLYKKLSV